MSRVARALMEMLYRLLDMVLVLLWVD
jgi:hypothetical protein